MYNSSMIETSPNPKRSMPRTAGLPLVGSLPALLRGPFDYMLAAQQRYGDIYQLRLGLLDLVVCNHPDHLQHILRDNGRNYRKGGGLWDSIRDLLGNGLPVSEGDFWLRQRRMMQPHFHHQRIAAMTMLMNDAISTTLAPWDAAAASGEPLGIVPALSAITMNVIVRTMFGTSLLPDEQATVAHSLTYVLDYIMAGVVTHSLPSWLPVPGKRRYRRELATIDTIIDRVIARCRDSRQDSPPLVALLLDMVDSETGEQMTEQQLRDEVKSIFSAGYETTSLALAWALFHLAQHPATLETLRSEVDSVLAGREATFADVARLGYTKMVVQESMRLYPPVWWLQRTAINDDELAGYPIKAGTHVACLMYTAHRHPDHWPEPDRFDPARFRPELVAQHHPFAWVPFGGGQRVCIGRDMALLEAQLVLSTLIGRYDLHLATNETPLPQLSTTLRPKRPLLMTVKRR